MRNIKGLHDCQDLAAIWAKEPGADPWQIGQMTKNVLRLRNAMVRSGADVREWTLFGAGNTRIEWT
jgi:hypothetical protein